MTPPRGSGITGGAVSNALSILPINSQGTLEQRQDLPIGELQTSSTHVRCGRYNECIAHPSLPGMGFARLLRERGFTQPPGGLGFFRPLILSRPNPRATSRWWLRLVDGGELQVREVDTARAKGRTPRLGARRSGRSARVAPGGDDVAVQRAIRRGNRRLHVVARALGRHLPHVARLPAHRRLHTQVVSRRRTVALGGPCVCRHRVFAGVDQRAVHGPF